MSDHDALRAALKAAGEGGTNFGGLAMNVALTRERNPAEAERILRTIDPKELHALRAITGRAGEPFAPVADLCDRVIQERAGT